MKTPSRPAARISPAVRFRAEIEKALGEGLARESLTLRLTHGDVSQLKRDRDLPIADISFAGGAMRFLGVMIEEGGVTRSELVRS
jgi:hypothetical protein